MPSSQMYKVDVQFRLLSGQHCIPNTLRFIFVTGSFLSIYGISSLLYFFHLVIDSFHSVLSPCPYFFINLFCCINYMPSQFLNLPATLFFFFIHRTFHTLPVYVFLCVIISTISLVVGCYSTFPSAFPLLTFVDCKRQYSFQREISLQSSIRYT